MDYVVKADGELYIGTKHSKLIIAKAWCIILKQTQVFRLGLHLLKQVNKLEQGRHVHWS